MHGLLLNHIYKDQIKVFWCWRAVNKMSQWATKETFLRPYLHHKRRLCIVLWLVADPGRWWTAPLASIQLSFFSTTLKLHSSWGLKTPYVNFGIQKTKQKWFIPRKGGRCLQKASGSSSVLFRGRKERIQSQGAVMSHFHKEKGFERVLAHSTGVESSWLLPQTYLPASASSSCHHSWHAVTAQTRGLLPRDCWFQFISLIYSFPICRLLKILVKNTGLENVPK